MTNISVISRTKITIHISGSQFDISIEDAKKLRDLLNKEIGDNTPSFPINIPNTTPYVPVTLTDWPYKSWPFPYTYPYEVTCKAPNSGAY